MQPAEEKILQTRRRFLATSASGIGGVALAALLAKDGYLATTQKTSDTFANPLAPKVPHFAPKANACIFLYMCGGPSQIDLFDKKPKLIELNGQPPPESITKNVRFAFIQKETAILLGAPKRTFKPYGQCGTEFSDLLPRIGGCADDIALVRSMHTDAFNHTPGQVMMSSGVMNLGRPVLGSWLVYALGSESENLPAYVVLSAGSGTSAGAANWSNGFLPSSYQGVPFRNQGDAILDLHNPGGVGKTSQRLGLDAIRDINQLHYNTTGDPEILARIGTYELAGRMQLEAPKLLDFGDESPKTLAAYGIDRHQPKDVNGFRSDVPDQFRTYARNCLLARRMVERGVRFISVLHETWDHHENLDKLLAFNCMMCDQPIAALLRDLKDRGLLDTTLVVWASEFGRTPIGENGSFFVPNTGRGHHPFAFSIWMAGGGIKGGQVVGETDEIGWNIVKDPVHVNDLHATILNRFGLDHERLTYRFQGRDFRLTNVAGKIVPKLFA